MALTTLQQLYPGGKRVEQTYAVKDELAGRPVVVAFKIGPDGLQQVAIVFAGAAARIDLEAPVQEREPTARAKKTWADVRALLEHQYGKPATESDGLVAWSSPVDSVVLTRTDEDATGLSRVAVTYMPASAVDEVIGPPAKTGTAAERAGAEKGDRSVNPPDPGRPLEDEQEDRRDGEK
jgi:hypothetical protein